MDIYDKHSAAFGKVAAYVIAKPTEPNGPMERVATIAFKHGNAVTAFVHFHGLEMQFGLAGGGGYDRASAACSTAAAKIRKLQRCENLDEDRLAYTRAQAEGLDAFLDALDDRDGNHWDYRLRKAGFTVWQAV